MKNVLVTGGAGFIGSNFVKMLLKKETVTVVNLDALTYAGNLENLTDISENKNYQFIHGNICDKDLVEKIMENYSIDWVVHFAAESHVDRSIEEAQIFLQTNVIGTQILLEAARKHWSKNPKDKYCSEYREGGCFLQVSTDEVYGSLGEQGYFTESSPIMPNSPYSASKASADLIVRAYFETYRLPVITTRSSNNYGPNQFPEKLIPLMINNARQDKALPVYGNGQDVRDWIHVADHCRAIWTVLNQGKKGEIYNVGGNNEKTNLEVVKTILANLGKPETLIRFFPNRPGADFRYALNNQKITSELGWEPKHDFQTGIKETINWYLTHTQWLENITSGEYRNYYRKMYGLPY